MSQIELTEHKDTLNEDQYKILNDLYSEITKVLQGSFATNLASLQGSAGVGKTFLLSILIKEISKKYKVRVTAPTHKAVGVLKLKMKDAKALNSNVTISTIHSYLKLKLQNNLDNGLVELVENSFDKDKTKNIDLLIIDESSMVSQQLYEYILKRLDNGDIKFVLFTGDILQLPPVDNNCDVIPVMQVHNTFKLDKVVRQAEGSEVIQQSQILKKCLESNEYLPLGQLFRECSSEIISLTSPKEFVNLYLNDPHDDKVILSFTNDSVDKYNAGIRKTIKGEVAQFLIDDEVIFNEAYNPDNSDFPLYSNNDIITIGKAELKYHEVHQINYWTINEKTYDPLTQEWELNESENIYVVDRGSLEYYFYMLNQLAGKAKVASGYDKKKLWAEYFEIKNKYADVRYTYSTTLHKSQGSSHRVVFLNLRGLENAVSYLGMEIVYRLIYVGITRTSGKVYVLRND